ncbi:MAG TPA: hypothetical protein VF803_00805 [Candidatus Paceibacterota bacterium]
MHPFADFPSLFSYSFFAPILLRLSASLVFFFVALMQWRARRETYALLSPILGSISRHAIALLVAIEYIIAAMLFVGWHTQIAAVLGVILSIKYAFVRARSLSPLGAIATWLLLSVCLSLIILGGGALALDIHL